MKTKDNTLVTRAAFFIREDRLKVSRNAQREKPGGVKGFRVAEETLRKQKLAMRREDHIYVIALLKGLHIFHREKADTLEPTP